MNFAFSRQGMKITLLIGTPLTHS